MSGAARHRINSDSPSEDDDGQTMIALFTGKHKAAVRGGGWKINGVFFGAGRPVSGAPHEPPPASDAATPTPTPASAWLPNADAARYTIGGVIANTGASRICFCCQLKCTRNNCVDNVTVCCPFGKRVVLLGYFPESSSLVLLQHLDQNRSRVRPSLLFFAFITMPIFHIPQND